MRIFMAGATGAVGQRLVPLLASAGHSIVGLTRSLAKAPLLRKLGAEPIVADALDRRAIQVAVQGARPDVIVHEMTDLKGASDLRAFDRSFAASNRLRTEGTDHLLAAAREVGVQRFLAQSFCGWPYARVGSAVKSEGDPLDPDPPKELSRTLAAIRYLEDIVTQSSSPEGIVLRYGAFYGDNTGLFDGPLLEQIRRRRAARSRRSSPMTFVSRVPSTTDLTEPPTFRDAGRTARRSRVSTLSILQWRETASSSPMRHARRRESDFATRRSCAFAMARSPRPRFISAGTCRMQRPPAVSSSGSDAWRSSHFGKR
jgi:putative NAD(P)-binding protein